MTLRTTTKKPYRLRLPVLSFFRELFSQNRNPVRKGKNLIRVLIPCSLVFLLLEGHLVRLWRDSAQNDRRILLPNYSGIVRISYKAPDFQLQARGRGFSFKSKEMDAFSPVKGAVLTDGALLKLGNRVYEFQVKQKSLAQREPAQWDEMSAPSDAEQAVLTLRRFALTVPLKKASSGILIGSEEAIHSRNDLNLIEDGLVFTHHARLMKTNDGMSIRNLTKTGGLTVDGHEIPPDQEIEIHDKGIIELGQNTFELAWEENGAELLMKWTPLKGPLTEYQIPLKKSKPLSIAGYDEKYDEFLPDQFSNPELRRKIKGRLEERVIDLPLTEREKEFVAKEVLEGSNEALLEDTAHWIIDRRSHRIRGIQPFSFTVTNPMLRRLAPPRGVIRDRDGVTLPFFLALDTNLKGYQLWPTLGKLKEDSVLMEVLVLEEGMTIELEPGLTLRYSDGNFQMVNTSWPGISISDRYGHLQSEHVLEGDHFAEMGGYALLYDGDMFINPQSGEVVQFHRHRGRVKTGGLIILAEGGIYEMAPVELNLATNRFGTHLRLIRNDENELVAVNLSQTEVWLSINGGPLRGNRPLQNGELLKIQGVSFEYHADDKGILAGNLNKDSRLYFQSNSHFIGYLLPNGESSGVERIFDDRLVNGEDFTLTLDEALNALALSILQDELDFLDQHSQLKYKHPQQRHGGAMVVLRIDTGELLAAASLPGFGDPNSPTDLADAKRECFNARFLNRAFTGVYTPGSIIKTITAAAFLEEDLDFNRLLPMDCGSEGGKIPSKGGNFFAVPCWAAKYGGHNRIGPVTSLESALMQSCDVAFARMGMALGEERLKGYLSKFGFGRPIPIHVENDLNLDDESLQAFQKKISIESGSFDPTPWTGGELAQIAFGQGSLTVTPIHAALIAATIANEGKMPPLQVIKGNGQPVSFGEQVISPETAKQVGAMMKQVAGSKTSGGRQISGTAYSAFRWVHPNLLGGGKTGTAQIAQKPYESEAENDHSWFIAFGPFPEPQIAVACVIENGGQGSGPAARCVRELLLAASKLYSWNLK